MHVLYFLLYDTILSLAFMNYGKRDIFIMNESWLMLRELYLEYLRYWIGIHVGELTEIGKIPITSGRRWGRKHGISERIVTFSNIKEPCHVKIHFSSI